jgi:hypothetical protein
MKLSIIHLFTLFGLALCTVLVSDDFSDGNADGWIEMPTGATYAVISGRYCFQDSAQDSAYGASAISDMVGGMSVSDYTCRFNTVLDDGDIVGGVIRTNPYLEHGYALFLNYSAQMIYLLKATAIGQGEVLSILPYTLTAGQEYWVRLEMSGEMIGARLWTGTAGDEPSGWDLTAVDSSFPDAGYFVLFGWTSDSGHVCQMDASFDDVEISDETTMELYSSTWADLKSLYTE